MPINQAAMSSEREPKTSIDMFISDPDALRIIQDTARRFGVIGFDPNRSRDIGSGGTFRISEHGLVLRYNRVPDGYSVSVLSNGGDPQQAQAVVNYLNSQMPPLKN